MNTRCNALAILSVISYWLLTLNSLSQVPLRWTADLARPAAADWGVYQGETVVLEPTFVSYGAPAAPLAAAFFIQTNGMGSSWWRLPATVDTGTPGRVSAVFAPTNDVGASEYVYWIKGLGAAGSSYRAFGTLAMRPSPGFSPAAAPAPSYYPTLAAEIAPYLAGLTNGLALSIAQESGVRSSADSHLQSQITQLAESGAITGGVSSATSADAALRLMAADSNRWVTADLGVWAVTNSAELCWKVSTAGIYSEGGDVIIPPGDHVMTSHFFAPPIDGLFFGDVIFEQIIESRYYRLTYNMPEGGLELYVVYQLGEGTSRTLTLQPHVEADSYTLSVDGDYPSSATITYGRFGSQSSAQTNRIGTVATIEQTDAATNAIVQRYLVASNAWIGVDFSNRTVSVSMVATNGLTNAVTISAASIDPQATNLLWSALYSGLAGKAPLAWGARAPDGSVNPDPDYMTWLNSPATYFASGCSWTTYGAYAALTTAGTTAFESGGDGAMRIGPDFTNWFGYVVGGSVLVGAQPQSLDVFNGGTAEGFAEITYAYNGGDYPVLWYSPMLGVVDFAIVANPAWSDNLDGTATVTAPAQAASGFWKATTSSVFGTLFMTTMPARFAAGIFGSTNATPVVYDSTVEISAGGHTYRIPAQLAD